MQLDPSFVAMVPLDGRHTNHMWKLLNDLGIPHATLLDLDYGKDGAGPARLRDACNRLIDNGIDPFEGLDDYDEADDIHDGLLLKHIKPIMEHLRTFAVFYAAPLDLAYAMLTAFTGEGISSRRSDCNRSDGSLTRSGSAKRCPRLRSRRSPGVARGSTPSAGRTHGGSPHATTSAAGDEYGRLGAHRTIATHF